MRSLSGRVAVVTGAASGIGRATSVELAGAGCRLALVDVDEEGMRGTARRVGEVGAPVTTHVADVSKRERMVELAGEVAEAHGAVNVLVNNAGVTVIATLDEHDLDDFEWIVGINFWGVVYGCKAFLPHLERAGEGHIVNVSSVFGLVGVPNQIAYSSTKFAVRGFSEALWAELRSCGIGVTCVHPGRIATNIVRSARTHEGTRALREAVAEDFDQRGAPPERVARKIVEAIRKNRPVQLVAPEAYLLSWMKRLLPGLTRRLVGRVNERALEAADEAAAARLPEARP